MAVREQDVTSSPFNVGDVVSVRCRVTVADGLGAGGRVTLLVETPGNIGEAQGVTFQVSPVQCHRSQGVTNSNSSGINNTTY